MTTTALLDALATRHLDKQTLQTIAADLARAATEKFATDTDDTKKVWCVAQLTAILTHFTNARDVLGVIADLPLSARVEKWAVRKLVEYAFLKLQEEEPKATLAPVPQSPTLTPADRSSCVE
jgi:hypothetical protein